MSNFLHGFDESKDKLFAGEATSPAWIHKLSQNSFKSQEHSAICLTVYVLLSTQFKLKHMPLGYTQTKEQQKLS